MKTRITSSSKSVTVAILFFAAIISLHAGTITVTNTNDSGPGSLRQALADANNGDTINFAVTGTIALTSGELLVDKSITISGPGADNLAVDANLKSRVCHINTGETVIISGLTIRGGLASGGGGIHNDHAALTLSNCTIGPNHAIATGGGIYNNGEHDGGAILQISSCLINVNFSQGSGGGISSDGSLGGGASLEIDASSITNNLANSGGGAIYNTGDSAATTMNVRTSTLANNHALDGAAVYNQDATSTLNNCTIASNGVDDLGAGIYNKGNGNGTAMLTVSNSTLFQNFAAKHSGGGIYNDGSSLGNANLQITNSTLSFNSAIESGGAIFNDGQSGGHASLEIGNSTFNGNSAGLKDAGIYNLGANGGEAAVLLANTILNASAATGNIINDSGTVTSSGYNLSSDDAGGFLTGPGDQIDTDPLLGPLQDNGGATVTHELLNGSPAIDAGDPSFTPPPFYDQRGPDFFRVRNGRIDIGSFEVQVGSTPSPTPPPTPTPTVTPTATPTATATPRLSPTPRTRPTPHHRPTPP